jgi:myo-inositol-1(or 4)-monophosphatase
MIPFSNMTNLATEAALEAGEILRKGFGTEYAVSFKPGIQNYVTEYDHASEKYIIHKIKSAYPDHGFFAEESGASNQDASVVWLIDPLDGTTNFAHHIPIFSITLAAMKDEEVFCGIVYQPMTQELFVAEKGKGAFLNGKRIHVSATTRFKNGLGATGFPRNVHENPLNCLTHYRNILTNGTIVRNFGSCAVNMAYVAAGCLDAYWAISLFPWDIAAGILLIQEAGGTVTTYQGNPYAIMSSMPLVASNGTIHEEVLSYLV